MVACEKSGDEWDRALISIQEKQIACLPNICLVPNLVLMEAYWILMWECVVISQKGIQACKTSCPVSPNKQLIQPGILLDISIEYRR